MSRYSFVRRQGSHSGAAEARPAQRHPEDSGPRAVPGWSRIIGGGIRFLKFGDALNDASRLRPPVERLERSLVVLGDDLLVISEHACAHVRAVRIYVVILKFLPARDDRALRVAQLPKQAIHLAFD